MAKRDKLYTVNKWNRPFFEQERRRKLYPNGGPIWGLNENQSGRWWSYGNQDYSAPLAVSNLTRLNSIDRAVNNFANYSGMHNPNYWQDSVKVYNTTPTESQVGPSSTNSTSSQDETQSSNGLLGTLNNFIANSPKLVQSVNDVTKAFKSTGTLSAAKAAGDAAVNTVISGKTYPFALSSFTGDIPAFAGTAEVSAEAAKHASDMIAKDIASASASTASKGTNFFNTGLGSGLAMTAADLASDYVGGLISPELNKTTAALIGNVIGKAGTAVGTGLMATGYGLPIGLLAMGVGKTLGALAKQFGSVKNDNGTSNYIYTLEGSNPQGSNEYLAGLMANTGYGPEATYSDGIFTDSGKYWARRQNRKVADAYENYLRKIRNALSNNNWIQMQHAIYENSKAMGGKLNRKKCNCKATGGFLNNAMLDSASATGYNFLSDLTNMQMQNNQNKQDMGSSLGNSFTGLSNGTLFANGGGININPAHKGEFTAKAKRHGMGVQQFANYVLAHKDKFPTSTIRQAVFAKNSNTWKKAFGGKLNYGKDKDIRDSGFFDGQTLYAIGGPLQAMSSNWSPGGNVTEINAGGQHEENPYEGVQVGVDPEGTPNLVEENEVIWNDYVFSNRLKVPKEVCKELRVGQKKDGFTFAEVAKKLLKESKERPNDPISKRGLDANMQKLEDAQEELKQKMEAEEAVEQFNSLPPEQQVAIMQQEGEKAQNAVAQEQMAQEIQNLPPEQQQAIAQQMAMEQAAAQGQGIPQGQPSPEEQAMMQQQMAQQQMPQSNINPQEALAQAAAMQQQAINGSAYGGKLCFGGRKFAEGGMIPQEGEQPAEQADSEMAKYSDEELQDMIEDYQEAESGEVKVTKGKLARLRKKAEKAERELERRHSQENEEQPQEARQEPSQEDIQAAAQEQAMQAQQPIEGQPLEGLSPEQAMMMQQQMGGQPLMSPEEAMAMQQQGQYACGGRLHRYGGRLYLTGGQLIARFGFPTLKAAEDAGWKPEDFGLTSWHDTIKKATIDKIIADNKAKWLDPSFINEKTIPNEDYRRAASGYNYNPFSPTKTPDNYDWYEPGPNGNLGIANFSNIRSGENPFDWNTVYGTNFQKGDTIIGKDAYRQIRDAYPYALADLEYKDGLKLSDIDAAIKASQDWKDTRAWLWDPQNGAANRLQYMAMIAPNNEENGKLRGAKQFSAQNIYNFEKQADGTYKVTLKATPEQEKAWWDAVTTDYKYGDMYNTRHTPAARNIYIDLATGDELPDKPGSDWVLVGNPYSSYIAATEPGGYDYNQNIYFYKKKDAAGAGDEESDESNYLTVGWKPKTNWTDYTLGMLPGLTGLTFQIAQGKPDTSGLDAAAAFADRYAGIMAPPHLTHGLMTPAIIDPRVTHNTANASRLGVNRTLRNTGSAPSQAASILANDTNYQHQMGQNDLRDWLANREQEQKATTFNEGVARANATFLNDIDKFNTQMMADAGQKSAQIRYNAELEKLNQNNAYRAGLLGNIGSMMTGLYNAYREGQNRNERDLLAASEVFGPTNGLLDEYYGISKVDPKTGKVVRGPYTDWYWYDNDFHKQPKLAISAKGGKLNKKSKKKKGYTF